MKKNQSRRGLKSASPKTVLIGNRIPRDYFVTKGSGESNIAIHAWSYHLALKSAGIEMWNIMTYSSILPGIAREIPQPKNLVHGEVMESIMATATSPKWERATAGIIHGRLYDKKTGKKFWWLVCEHNGNYTITEIQNLLKASINELYVNGFDKKYDLKNFKLVTETIVPKKKYWTALVSLCFVNYVCPIL